MSTGNKHCRCYNREKINHIRELNRSGSICGAEEWWTWNFGQTVISTVSSWPNNFMSVCLRKEVTHFLWKKFNHTTPPIPLLQSWEVLLSNSSASVSSLNMQTETNSTRKHRQTEHQTCKQRQMEHKVATNLISKINKICLWKATCNSKIQEIHAKSVMGNFSWCS